MVNIKQLINRLSNDDLKAIFTLLVDGTAISPYTAGVGISITEYVVTNSAPNKVQSLSISGTTVTLSNGGGSINIPTGSTYTGGAGIAIAGNTVTNTAPNIIQTISGTGNTIQLSNGGGGYTFTNTTYSAGTNMSLAGNSFSVSSSPNFSGSVTATSFYESSLRKYKTNIKSVKISALSLVDTLKIVTFDRVDIDLKNKIGVIADDTRAEFLSPEKTEVDLYKTVFIQAKAIQELSRINRLMDKRLKHLEALLLLKEL